MPKAQRDEQIPAEPTTIDWRLRRARDKAAVLNQLFDLASVRGIDSSRAFWNGLTVLMREIEDDIAAVTAVLPHDVAEDDAPAAIN